jgi:fructokinase
MAGMRWFIPQETQEVCSVQGIACYSCGTIANAIASPLTSATFFPPMMITNTTNSPFMPFAQGESRIVALGEVLWDLFDDGARFGGATANFACHASRQGAKVSILSAVGKDELGDAAIHIIKGFGVDVSLMQRVADVKTGSVGVTVDANGKPSYEIHADAAWDHVHWCLEADAMIVPSTVVYFGTLGMRSNVSRETYRRLLLDARARGSLRILDINLRSPFYDAELIRECLQLCNVLKLSDEELPTVLDACGIDATQSTPDCLKELLRSCRLELVALTRGAEGALLVTANEVVDQPGIKTTVVDTVGAGDAFTAALAVGLLSGATLCSVSENACKLASDVCRHAVALPC